MSVPVDHPKSRPIYMTPDGKVCILCDGYHKLPPGPVHGFCFNRNERYLPDDIRERFICMECAVFLLKRLVEQASNSFYIMGFRSE